MADKSSQLILAALSRAAAAGAGLPLFGTKTTPGLFPTNAAGKQAAQRCQEDGYLSPAAPVEADTPEDTRGPIAVARKKTTAAALYVLSEKGMAHLLAQVSPRQVLEDFVRVLETRQQQSDELLGAARRVQLELEALKASADRVLRHIVPPDHSPERNGTSGGLKALFAGFLKEANLSGVGAAPAAPKADTPPDDAVLAELTRWHDASSSEDCPLPHLFRQLAAPGCTIGQFHDALRRLHDGGRVYLHPWTGPLYDIPEPPYALLIGHEIAYYASIRK